ncbi:MAG: hypothetical protein IT374_11245 [Polyangiaceae bacterium]|nr:hypothetical protein [Polyangiaceae bacterium]
MTSRTVSRKLAAPLLALALALAPAPAIAAGSITPVKTELTEIAGGWKIFLTIKLPKKPATPHQTFRFSFTKKVYYETFKDDAHGDAEQSRSVPITDAQPSVESLDVNFGDVKGNVWETTKLDFTIRRERGYEAGEYKVEVRDGDGRAVGQAFTIKLQGKNDTIDRRAMVMADGGKKKKEEKKEEKKEDAKPEEKAAPASDAPPPADAEAKPAAAPPPPVEKKAGGCGCEVPGPAREGHGALWLGAAALGLSLARRRR